MTFRELVFVFAALVGGGLIAKKAGLFALIGLLIVKFDKIFAIGAAVLGGGLIKTFCRNGGTWHTF